MHECTMTDSQTDVESDDEQYWGTGPTISQPVSLSDVVGLFDEHPHVDSVELDQTRIPHRLGLTLTGSSITPGLRDLIDVTSTRIEYADCSTADGALYVELVTEEPLRPAGRRKLRQHGPSSIVLTLPPEALELSGFEGGDEIQLRARDDEIHLTPW